MLEKDWSHYKPATIYFEIGLSKVTFKTWCGHVSQQKGGVRVDY